MRAVCGRQGACLLVGADGVPEDVDGVGDHGNGAVLRVLVSDPVPAITRDVRVVPYDLVHKLVSARLTQS